MPATKRQKDIMNATLTVIAAEGVEHLTVRRIADRLSITDAALYKHFDGKTGILAAIVEEFRIDSLKALDAAAKGVTPIDKVRLFFLDRADYFASHPEMVPVLFPESMVGGNRRLFKAVLSAMDDHKQALVVIIGEAQRKREIRIAPPEHVFIMIMGTLRLLFTRWQYSGHGFDLAEEARALWASLVSLISDIK
ncbi:MAG: TetR/AcrR family transcriptional regulator [Spirochaetota bacterium]